MYKFLCEDIITQTDLKGGGQGGRAAPPPNVAPNTFQERPSGASRMHENLVAAEAPPRTMLGSLQRSSRTPSWWRGSKLPLPKNTTPALGPLGASLRASPLAQNRRFGPSQHHWLGRFRQSIILSVGRQPYPPFLGKRHCLMCTSAASRPIA